MPPAERRRRWSLDLSSTGHEPPDLPVRRLVLLVAALVVARLFAVDDLALLVDLLNSNIV